MTCTPHQISLRWSIEGRDGQNKWYIWGRKEMNTGIWCENWKRDHFDGKPMHRVEVLEWTIRILSQICVNVQLLCAFDAKTAH